MAQRAEDQQEQLAPQIQGVNKDFFAHFGHPDNPDSFLASSKLLMVRHAQSLENVHWENNKQDSLEGLTDDVIYGTLRDCHLSPFGVEQARQCQPLLNQFQFPLNRVYASPHRRTIETLCNILDTHPQKGELTLVLIPLAKEVMSSYGNVPVLVADLREECQQTVVVKHGLKAVDLSLLNDDNLWYLKQLELADSSLKDRYLQLVEPVKDGNHVKVFQEQIFAERLAQGLTGEQALCIESNAEIYNRTLKLHDQLAQIVRDTEAAIGKQIQGREKILIVSHSRTIRAFASNGVNPEKPSRFLNSFYSHNTLVTPFQLLLAQGDESSSSRFVHNRPENYDY